ncbi:MAG: Hsp70 family protein [Nannocystaceae bacterium]|nr:Hsp70 family protein [Nannocystaceae bacterium]
MGEASGTHLGIDFGTSNSAVAVAAEDGDVEFLTFSLLGAETQSYRSLLFFDPEEQDVRKPIQFHAGVEAIEAYLEAMGEGRLVQSFKTHLTSATLGRTQIGHHGVSLEDMLSLFFLRLRAHLERQRGAAPDHLMLGRPVNFAGATTEEMNNIAQERLAGAAMKAGFSEVRFELEPIAAAYHYERALTRPELALVADFGGGTTDFCLMRLGPRRHQDSERQQDIVATGGVGIAGDDLDATIIEHLVCPHLGLGTTYVEMGREMPIPHSYFYKLSRWHHLSFLRGKRTLAELDRLRRRARKPEAIAAFLHVLENNQGFHLHKAVERAKISLSTHEKATFHYTDGPVNIEVPVERSQFEGWIAEHVAAIADALDQTLANANVTPQEIDRVFMTGGTAFVPCVRREFETRFGREKLSGGDELMSIASGLSLHAARTWG